MSSLSSGDNSPFQLNFEQQKKRAKELLIAVHSGDNTALSRLEKYHKKSSARPVQPNNIKPSDAQLSKTQLSKIQLSDTQYVIAMELGLPSWARLKTHINSMSQTSQLIKNKSIADNEVPTLHIRCGTDLKKSLPAAGFTGDYLEYSQPYCQGPVVFTADFLQTRAKFLYESYAVYVDKTQQQTLDYLQIAEQKLISAADNFRRIVFWFEHDTYDQFILARLLAYFAEHKQPEQLQMISINNFPGSDRFIGLGQLPAAAIRLLWQQRQTISRQQCEAGQQIWMALANNTPQRLNELRNSSVIHHLPHMANALLRHLQEFPSCHNGLSLTEQLSLEMLNEKSQTAGQLFKQLLSEREPLPWLGDIMYWFILQSMLRVSQPVFNITPEDLNKPWDQRNLSITQTGIDVLSGKLDWLSLYPPVRWLGGVELDPEKKCWRWDDTTQQLS